MRISTSCACTLVLLMAALAAWPGPARAEPGPPGGGTTVRGVWPLSPRPDVVRGFDPPDVSWGTGHRGVDLAASVGQAVLAAADGVVSFAGVLAGRGVVVVVHGGLRTTYEPVTTAVSVGDRVQAGDVIGHLHGGSGHCVPVRPCLHWGLLRGREYLDPLSLLRRGPSRLLPIWGVYPPDGVSVPLAPDLVGDMAAPAVPEHGPGAPGQGLTGSDRDRGSPGPDTPDQEGPGRLHWPPPLGLLGALGFATGGPARLVPHARRAGGGGVVPHRFHGVKQSRSSSRPGIPVPGSAGLSGPAPRGGRATSDSPGRVTDRPKGIGAAAGESGGAGPGSAVLNMAAAAGGASVLGLTGIVCVVRRRPRRSRVEPLSRADSRWRRQPWHGRLASLMAGPERDAGGGRADVPAPATRLRSHPRSDPAEHGSSRRSDRGSDDATAWVALTRHRTPFGDGRPLADVPVSATYDEALLAAVAADGQRQEMQGEHVELVGPDDTLPKGGDVVDLSAERRRRRSEPPPQPA